MIMFEKFGELNLEELNKTAEGFKSEGDEASLFALAQENGLEKEDAEDYLDGLAEEFATPVMAAMGRIAVWRQHTNGNLNEKMAIGVILAMLQTMVKEPEMAEAVMGRGKDPETVLDAMRREALKHAQGTGNDRFAVSCGTDQQLKDILRAYFMEEKKLGAKIAALYTLDGGAR